MVTIFLIGGMMVLSLLKIKPGGKGWQVKPELGTRMTGLLDGRLLVFHGHHFECTRYLHHEIKWKNKSICAGCYGTATGLIFALIFTIAYYFVVTRNAVLLPVPFESLLVLSLLFLLLSQSRYLVPIFTGRRVDPRFAFLAHGSLPLAITPPLVHSLSLESNLSVITALLFAFALIGVRLLSAGSEHGETCNTCEQVRECTLRATNL
jgi:hypothetical protein